MTRRSLLVLITGFSFLLAPHVFAQAPSDPVVEGTLVGHDGTPMEQAHVRVEAPDLDGNVKLRIDAVAKDGSYRVPVDTTGIVILQFMGKNHQSRQVVTYAMPGDTIGLNAQLRPPSYVKSFSSLRLIGSFNDFSVRGGAQPMRKQSDGTYAATVPAPGDSLSYQVLGAARTSSGFPRPVQGTQEDAIAFDGFGYRSVVHAPEDSIRIHFDPNKLVRSEVEAQLQFHDSTTIAARYAAFIEAVKARGRRYQRAFTKAKTDSARQVVQDTFDWTPSRKRLEQALAHEQPEAVDHAFRIGYLQTTKIDSTTAQQFLNEVPPSSSAWSLRLFPRPVGSRAVSRVIQETGRVEAYLPYAYEVLRTNPSESVKADLLLMLTRRAKEQGNESRQRTFYTWLQAEYGGSRTAGMSEQTLDPNQAVKSGQPVPEFAVQDLRDSTRTFRPADFEGQYLLLDFWASWCAPCIDAFPKLRNAHEQHGETLAILSISVDEKRAAALNVVTDRTLPWEHAYAGGGLASESEVIEQFQVGSVPTYVLIGPDGKIVTKSVHHEEDPLPNILDRVAGVNSSSDTDSSAEVGASGQ